jgi:hypothetical protein
MGAGGCCAGVCEGGFCGPAICNHSPCVEGDSLSPACSACAETVCGFDPFCCQVFWDGICVDEAGQFCAECGGCTPNGSTCATDAECCSGDCGANGLCVTDTPCAHGECEEGVALDPNCDPCVAAVCMADPFCCNGGWDAACVANAEATCGVDCGVCAPEGAMCQVGADCCDGNCAGGVCVAACLPDGSMCSTFDDCCSNTCENGVCVDQCLPDGSFCQSADECCSDVCIAGFCGPSECPSDGSECGDCVAGNCCTQLLDCFSSPDCVQDVACFLQCVQGGGPVQCFFQCVNNPQAFQALGCFATNCAGACF